MKKELLVLVLIVCGLNTTAQNKPGYLQIGMHGAFPQKGLKKAEYDKGAGLHMGLITRGMTFKSQPAYSLHGGFFMDFDWMDRREFDVMLNTPVPDHGRLEVYNSSFGFFGVLRNQFQMGNTSLYGDLVFGGRSYTTSQTITAKNPFLNPEYESTTYSPDVVLTSKPQVGFGAGLLFKINGNLYGDMGFTYCSGPEGLVQPLKDISQEGNEIRYNPKMADTDILLIKGTLVLLIKKREYNHTLPYPTQTPQPYEQEIRRTEPRPYNPPARQQETTPKKSLEVKPNAPSPKKKIDY